VVNRRFLLKICKFGKFVVILQPKKNNKPMETKSLRAWIIAMLACLGGYVLYSGLINWIPNTLFFQYFSIFVYSTVPLCVMMIGLLFTKEDSSKLAKWGGALFAIDGAIGLLWQVLLLIGKIQSTTLISTPLLVSHTCLGALLKSAAFILFALYFADKRMLGWAIVIAVSELAFAGTLSAWRMIPDNHILMSLYALFSVIVLVCEVVFLAKMLKKLK